MTHRKNTSQQKEKPIRTLIERQVRSTEDDETYLNLIHELDAERERRWKSEQASRKLLDNLKALKETCNLFILVINYVWLYCSFAWLN